MRSVRFMLIVEGLMLAAVVGACSAGADATESALTSGPERSPAEAPTAPTHSTSAGSSPSHGAEPSPASEWIETASFGGDETIQAVHDVAEAPFGLIAVGVELSTRSLAVFGPLPGGGRVWVSDDGSTWEDVTPESTFDGAYITQLVVLGDGSVLALGRAERLVDGFPMERPMAWETMDGRTWQEAPLTVGDDPVLGLAAGPRGYLALGGDEFGGQQLGHSEDGRTFAPVAGPADGSGIGGIAAGPEGFAIRAHDPEGAEPVTIHASGNGLDWYAATTEGWDPADVAPVGPDWIAVDARPLDLLEDVEVQTWVSGNGLDWAKAGLLPLRAIPVGEGGVCGEHPRLVSTGGFVVASMALSYPCGEGRVETFGSAYITSDGDVWQPLAFVGSVGPADASTRGTRVAAGLDLESGTLLVGEKNYRATFWFRPSD